MLRYLWVGWLLLLAGCAPQSAPVSAWGKIVTLAQAEQAGAPALWASSEQVTAAWVGADETHLFQAARTVIDGQLSPIMTLPLARAYPHAQQLFPASNGNLHLLWLDADVDGETRLFAALLSPQLELRRGPTPVSDRRVFRYVAISSGDGALWVVYSGGLVAEPALFVGYVDAEGRARQDGRRLVTDADWPSLAQAADGATWLLWRQPSDGQVQRARFMAGTLDTARATAALPLNTGDRLESVQVAFDQTHGYVFWNITRASGQAETYWASGVPEAGEWSPARFGIAPDAQPYVITGFNTGMAEAASSGDQWVSQAAPLAGVHPTLPVAGRAGTGLVVVYLYQGQIAAYQTILQNSHFVGLPALQADRDLFLYLAWAEPAMAGAADLQLSSLKFQVSQ